LVQKILAKSFPTNEDLEQYNITLKYEGKRQDWWINIANTEGMGYAIQDGQDQGYALISATIESKVARAVARAVSPKVETLPLVSHCAKATAKPKAVKKRTTAKHSAPSRSAGGKKKSVGQKILSAIAELRLLGISTPRRVQVAFFSGYGNGNTPGFAKALSILKKNEYIEYPSKQTVNLTVTGNAEAGPVADPATSNAVVHERIKKYLKGGKTGLILDQLSDGLAHKRMDVATATGYTIEKLSGFAKIVSNMKSLGILDYPKDATDPKNILIQLTDTMFPFGRPGSTGTFNNNISADYDAEVSADEDASEPHWL
jgi:hypothetical protein